MEDRYLFKGKEKDSGKWLEWNAIAGIPHNVTILTNTICQCTGLKDKNGNLIWENDVVKEITTINFGNDKAKVSWIESEWMLEWKTKCFYRKDMKFWTSEKIIEVIGNIFEGEFNGKNSKKD